MGRKSTLNDVQRKRTARLTKQLKEAAYRQDYELAKAVYQDLMSLLPSHEEKTRIYKLRVLLFRAAIDSGNIDGVEKGLQIIIDRLNSNTKGWLSAHANLAILYLKINRFEESKNHIHVVLSNEQVIRNEDRRKKFHQQFIERLEEEAVIICLRKRNCAAKIDPEKLENDVARLFQRNLSETEMIVELAEVAPIEVSQFLLRIDRYARDQLPYRMEMLPGPRPDSSEEKEFVGKRIFKALKLRSFAALCDPNSQVNKLWTEKGIGGLFAGSIIGSSIGAVFQKHEIACGALAAPFVGMMLKVGIEAVCDSISKEPDYLT